MSSEKTSLNEPISIRLVQAGVLLVSGFLGSIQVDPALLDPQQPSTLLGFFYAATAGMAVGSMSARRSSRENWLMGLVAVLSIGYLAYRVGLAAIV